MQLAILGTDPDILNLAAAAVEAGHEFVWVGDVRPLDAAAIDAYSSGLVYQSNQWELLLDRAIADAVLVGHGAANDELRAEWIKRLTTEGVPLLVVQPAFESVLPYYEVDMVRREYGGIVQHNNPLAGHPLTPQLAEWTRNGHPEIGAIHQLACERRLGSPERRHVWEHFTRDIELLAAIAGDIRRVTAIGPAVGDSSYASLQIQMKAADANSLRWSVGFAKPGNEGLEIALRGERGSITLTIQNAVGNGAPVWRLTSTTDGASSSPSTPSFDPAKAAITRLAEAVGQSQPNRGTTASTWDVATRAMEVVDAAELSLQKGRTMEVFQQQLTEKLAFRGTMAAIGCGLILFTFFAVIGIAMLGGAEGLVKQKMAPGWSLVLLAVLAFFLFLQAVPLMVRKRDRDSVDAQPAAGDDRRT